MGAYEHVHFTEIRSRPVRNPLGPYGIKPYRDRTVPEVDSISLRPTSSLVTLDTANVCGTVSLVAAAHDTPPIPVPGAFAGFPVSPALITWSLARLGGETYVGDVPAADFRTTLPAARTFWNVYARGSYQNAPRFSNQQYFMPGRFLYNLTSFLDTRSYPDGVYEVTVRASDMRGNASEAVEQFAVANQADCPSSQVPNSAP